MVEWWTRHSRSRKREKGDVGVEKEKEKQEGERMETFFSAVFEFWRTLRTTMLQISLLRLSPGSYAVDTLSFSSSANSIQYKFGLEEKIASA